MTRTIQKQACDPVTLSRRAFLLHAGELYGSPLTVERVEELLPLDDLAIVRAAFPFLDDAGTDEAVWALGEWVADPPPER